MDDSTSQRLVAAVLAGQAASVAVKVTGDYSATRYVKVYKEILEELRRVEKDEMTARSVNEFTSSVLERRR